MGDKEWEMSPMGLPKIISMHCCSATANPLELKSSPIVHAGQLLFWLHQESRKRMSLPLCERLKFHYSQLKFKQSWFWKAESSCSSFEEGEDKAGKEEWNELRAFQDYEGVHKEGEREWERYNTFNHWNLECQVPKLWTNWVSLHNHNLWSDCLI